jgi:hypothetical protein
VSADDPNDGFAADVDAAAAAGLSLETFTYLTSTQFGPGQLAQFVALDPELQRYVLRMLAGIATLEDDRWFNRRDDAKAVASWMLELPPFRHEPDATPDEP